MQAPRIAIVASCFNKEMVDGLVAAAQQVFAAHGFTNKEIDLYRVPGAFELPLAAQRCAKTGRYAGVLALGVVIQGETAHFEYICQAATQGLMQVGLTEDLPVIYGLLTAYTEEQAQIRVAKNGHNKGAEVAQALIEMLDVFKQIG